MAVTSFTTNLKSLETDYSSRNIDWVKYVHDHYKNIFASCKTDILDINSHYWEYYRMEDYLRSKNYDPNMTWIVLYINQIPSNVEFKDIKSLLLPDVGVIQGLYRSFLQNRSQIKSCRNT